ncbi:MAG TPA: DUF1906 domain-containing protein [Thermoanaerobaculia bacterium]|nr:DUF1906 domain-containing protein [Thermoanaerobaculia bacterium]
MPNGFDTNQNCSQQIACISQGGYQFVGRYYNVNNPSKNLTHAEAHLLSAGGIALVAVWENGYPTKASYFTFQAGVNDSTSAYNYGSAVIGQPAGSAIYFAVDYDASAADIAGPIADYFRGVSQGFQTISSGNPIFKIGVYGSGNVCTAVLASGVAQYAWLSQSTGWGGSKTFANWNIKQGAVTTVCDLDSDLDQAIDGDYGSFTIS